MFGETSIATEIKKRKALINRCRKQIEPSGSESFNLMPGEYNSFLETRLDAIACMSARITELEALQARGYTHIDWQGNGIKY